MKQLSSQEIATVVELSEANAWADMYLSAPPEIARELDLKVKYFGSAVARQMGSIDSVLVNSVVALGVAEPATEEMVDAILAFYRGASVRFMVQLSPAAQPGELPQWLEARGIRRGPNWVKVYRGIEPPPAIQTTIRIERVGPDRSQLFAETAFEGFQFPPPFQPIIGWIPPHLGRPGWTHYLGFDGDTPIATGALYVRDDVGWLGFASTLPAHRGRGAQGAMFAQRINDAIAQGCKLLVTETHAETADHPNPSYHNMRRMGFELVHMRANYVFRPT
jgi:hypothetical protein